MRLLSNALPTTTISRSAAAKGKKLGAGNINLDAVTRIKRSGLPTIAYPATPIKTPIDRINNKIAITIKPIPSQVISRRLSTTPADPRHCKTSQKPTETSKTTETTSKHANKTMNDRVLWRPSDDRVTNSQITRFIHAVNHKYNLDIGNYEALHAWSTENKEQFWAFIVEFCDIKLHGLGESPLRSDTIFTPDDLLKNEHAFNPGNAFRPENVYTPGSAFHNGVWFPGASLNFAENLLRYADVNGEKTAIVSISENRGREEISFNALEFQVAQVMLYLQGQGISVGDRVAAIMPNVHETLVAMLATMGVGGIWTSCSPDFGEQSIVDRLGQTQPKVLIVADGYQYKGKQHDITDNIIKIQKKIPSIDKIITVPIIGVSNTDYASAVWNEIVSNKSMSSDSMNSAAMDTIPRPSYEPVPFNQPGFILYSSGTTGKPKCITHSVGGTLLQHAKELRLHTDLTDKDTHFFFTTCGWMMWNWLTSTLQTGATTVLYDGSPFHPKQDILLDLVEQEGITAFGAGARYYAELEKQGINASSRVDVSSLKTVMSTGSPLSPASYHYIYNTFKEDVCLSSISGGTDILSCFALGNPTKPVVEGELQCLGLGMDVDVFDEAGRSVKQSKGELVCKTPFPSMPVGFWGDEDGGKYQAAYFDTFKDVWAHGDFAELTEQGGLIIHGRSDTVLNPGGVRIGTAEIYRQMETIDEVLESIVVDQAYQGDTRIVMFVRLRPEVTLTEQLQKKIRTTIRTNTTARHVPATIAAVPDIPRTFSGKIVEMAVKAVVNNQSVNNLGAIANPEALAYFKMDTESLETKDEG